MQIDKVVRVPCVDTVNLYLEKEGNLLRTTHWYSIGHTHFDT